MFKKGLLVVGLSILLSSPVLAESYKVDGNLYLKISSKGIYQGFDIDSTQEIKGVLDLTRAEESAHAGVDISMYVDGEESFKPYSLEMYLKKDTLEGFDELGEAESDSNLAELEGEETGLYDFFMKSTKSDGSMSWDKDVLEEDEGSKVFIKYSDIDNYIKKVFGEEKEGALLLGDVVDKLSDIVGEDISVVLKEYEELLGGTEIGYKISRNKKGKLKKVVISLGGIDCTEFMKSSLSDFNDIEDFKANIDEVEFTAEFKYGIDEVEVPDDVREEAEANYRENMQKYLEELIGKQDTESEGIETELNTE